VPKSGPYCTRSARISFHFGSSRVEWADGSSHVRPVGVGVGELAEQFFCKKTDGRAPVEAEIVVLVFNLAGNLDEAVVRVDEYLHRFTTSRPGERGTIFLVVEYKEIPTDMFRRLSIALLAATVSVPLSIAQMRGAMGRPVSVAHVGFARGVRGGIGFHHQTRPFTRGVFLGSPFLYSDYDPSEPYVVESAPLQVVVMQPEADDPRKTRPTPLLIE